MKTGIQVVVIIPALCAACFVLGAWAYAAWILITGKPTPRGTFDR